MKPWAKRNLKTPTPKRTPPSPREVIAIRNRSVAHLWDAMVCLREVNTAYLDDSVRAEFHRLRELLQRVHLIEDRSAREGP